MKSADIDKEILTALFDKIIESEKKTGSFKVSEETKRIFEEILNSSIINPYTKNNDEKIKKKIVFFKQKIIEFIRKENLLENWENANYLKLEEKEAILEDIINIETFIKFYYHVIKNITDKIQEYKRKWDKNNLLKNNIIFLNNLKNKVDYFKDDELYKEYKNKLNLIEKNLEIEIKKSTSNDKEYLINNWKEIDYISTEDKIIILNNINKKEDFIIFYNRFENSLKSLKPKNEEEKEIVKDYLLLFYNKFLEFKDKFKSKKEIEFFNKSIKYIEYIKDTYFLSKKDCIKKHWKDRIRLSLDEKIYVLEKIINLEEKEKKEDLNLFINQFEGNIVNMTSRILKKWNKKDISKLNNFFIELLQEIKKYELKINTKTIHKLEKNITKLSKNQ